MSHERSHCGGPFDPIGKWSQSAAFRSSSQFPERHNAKLWLCPMEARANPGGQNSLLRQTLLQKEPSQRTDLRILSGSDGDGGDGRARRCSGVRWRSMARAWRPDPRVGQDAAEFIRRFGAFSHHGDFGLVASALVEVWNALEMQRGVAGHPNVGLLLMAIEQMGDSGLELAQLLEDLSDPLLEAMSRSVHGNAVVNHSRLAE